MNCPLLRVIINEWAVDALNREEQECGIEPQFRWFTMRSLVYSLKPIEGLPWKMIHETNKQTNKHQTKKQHCCCSSPLFRACLVFSDPNPIIVWGRGVLYIHACVSRLFYLLVGTLFHIGGVGMRALGRFRQTWKIENKYFEEALQFLSPVLLLL